MVAAARDAAGAETGPLPGDPPAPAPPRKGRYAGAHAVVAPAAAHPRRAPAHRRSRPSADESAKGLRAGRPAGHRNRQQLERGAELAGPPEQGCGAAGQRSAPGPESHPGRDGAADAGRDRARVQPDAAGRCPGGLPGHEPAALAGGSRRGGAGAGRTRQAGAQCQRRLADGRADAPGYGGLRRCADEDRARRGAERRRERPAAPASPGAPRGHPDRPRPGTRCRRPAGRLRPFADRRQRTRHRPADRDVRSPRNQGRICALAAVRVAQPAGAGLGRAAPQRRRDPAARRTPAAPAGRPDRAGAAQRQPAADVGPVLHRAGALAVQRDPQGSGLPAAPAAALGHRPARPGDPDPAGAHPARRLDRGRRPPGPLCRPRPGPESRHAGPGAPARRQPVVRRRHDLGPAARPVAFRCREPVCRPGDPRRRHREAAGARRTRYRPRAQDLGAASRRHAPGHRGAARQGPAGSVPHDGQPRLVEPAALRPLRRNAAADGGAGPRRRRSRNPPGDAGALPGAGRVRPSRGAAGVGPAARDGATAPGGRRAGASAGPVRRPVQPAEPQPVVRGAGAGAAGSASGGHYATGV